MIAEIHRQFFEAELVHFIGRLFPGRTGPRVGGGGRFANAENVRGGIKAIKETGVWVSTGRAHFPRKGGETRRFYKQKKV